MAVEGDVMDKITGVQVKTEIEESSAPPSDEEIDDQFLSNHVSAGGEQESCDASQVGRPRRKNRRKLVSDEDSEEDDWTRSKNKPQKKMASSRGKSDEKLLRTEKNALSKRQKRSLMDAEEKERNREKWKLKKQQRRQRGRLRREEEDDDDADRTPRRPFRQAKLKPVVKEEPESEDEDYDKDQDYKLDEEDFSRRRKTKSTARKSTGGGRNTTPKRATSKKKISEMNEEEQFKIKEKWREEARARRARKRPPPKTEDEDSDSNETKKRVKTPRSSASRSRGSGGRRKKVDEMTEEEREAIKAKWREEARLKRARKQVSMTPEQREEHLREQRERKRMQRALARETMTPEQREQEKLRIREKKKAERAQLTPEQKREIAQKKIMQRIEKRAMMTEEEKQALRMKAYFQRMARMDSMTPEEIERRRQQRIEYLRRRRENMTAEDLEREKLKRGPYPKKAMTPEQRARYLEKLREGYKRKADVLKQDPEQWEKRKQKWRENRLKRKKRLEEMGKIKKRNYYRLVRHPNETPEQRVERIRESKRLTQKRIKIKKKLAIQTLLESDMSLDEIQEQIEAPEQREERLMRKRIYKAKFVLRKRLEGAGASPEEIEQKLAELERTYQPTFPFRPYKPRAETWDPVDPNDLALLGEDNPMIPSDVSTSLSQLIPSKKEPAPSKPSTSKTHTTTATTNRRGGALKTPQVQQQQQTPIPKQEHSSRGDKRGGGATSSPVLLQSTQRAMVHPPSSPAGASSCSYVSAAETPEPLHYACQQQYHAHQQFPAAPQSHHAPSVYNQAAFSHPQQRQAQTQPYSLQHILDSISYQESGSYGPPIGAAASNQVSYQHHAQHHDYASSNNDYSPPGSPGGGDDAHDYSSATFNDFSFNNGPPQQFTLQSKPGTSTSPSRRPGRPRKSQPARPKDAGYIKRGVKGTRPQEVCDECGVMYSRVHLHKLHFHNPNYKDKKCQLCGEEFKAAKYWYKHYIHTHQDQIPRLAKDNKERSHLCTECGQLFREKYGLEKHKYYRHGEGLKKENWKRCPICPGEKLFKETVSYYSHLKKMHPDYNKGGYDCYRCDQTFPNEKPLCEHVQQDHPDSYFPCQYCNACRFTKLGLNFHYLRCTKIGKETRDNKKKSAEGVFSLDRESLPCEFCKRKVTVGGLSRHYWEMHNVREDSFACSECGKGFKRRDYWVVHMEEKHLKSLEEMKNVVRCLNVKSRDGLVIENLEGLMGGVPRNTPGKAAAQLKREAMGRKGYRGGKKKKKVNKRNSDTESEGENDKLTEKTAPQIIRLRKGERRRIAVLAEEDEQELGKERVYMVIRARGGGIKSKPKTGTRKKNHKESSEEEEEENWSESENDDEEEEHVQIRKTSSVAGTKRKSRTSRTTRENEDNGDDQENNGHSSLETSVKCEILSDTE